MKPNFISAIDENMKPCAVKGRVIGSVGRGFVAFRPCESDDHICIHERFVFDSWLYALRRARRTYRRYRQGFVPSGTNGYVTTRLNGAIKTRIDGRKGPDIQVRTCDGYGERHLSHALSRMQ